MTLLEKLRRLIEDIEAKRLPRGAIKTERGTFHTYNGDQYALDDEGLTVTRTYRISLSEIKDVT